MKVRLGFISNSSTSGYVVSLEEFANILELAGYFTLNVIHHEEGEARYELVKKYSTIFNNLLRASQSNLDPDTPIFIPTHNFDTRIVKRENAYYIDTDHEFWFSVKGSIDGIEEGDYGKYTKSDYFYIPEFDVIGNYKNTFYNSVCKDSEHNINIALQDGTIICPICNKVDLEKNAISPQINEEELEVLELVWREKFRESSQYFNWNDIRKLMKDFGVEMAARESVGYLTLYLEAIVKQVTRKCLDLSGGKKITADLMDKALEWVQTIKIKY